MSDRQPEGKRFNWRERLENLFTSAIVVIAWKLLAWACTYLPHTSWTQDQWFMMFVAASLALHLPSREIKNGHV